MNLPINEINRKDLVVFGGVFWYDGNAMSLPTASAVGFAVSGGQPTDARNWVSVDFDGHFSPLKRGYLVATEPTDYSPIGLDLAIQARELILGELRRQQHVPADIALGRAFARANGLVHGELHTGANASFDRRVFVGATAVIIDDHTMTVAQVPPGQLIMVEDGLVYAVPELDSWSPRYAANGFSPFGSPEPLGFSAQVRPHLAVTELRPGDVLAMTNSRCGEVVANAFAASGPDAGGVTYLFGRDPDLVLDFFRSLVIDSELDAASIAVLALPPLPGSLQIQTIADVGRRLREEWRHTRAVVNQWASIGSGQHSENPFRSHPEGDTAQSGGALKPMIEIPEYSIATAPVERSSDLPPTLSDGLKVSPDPARAERRAGFQDRLLRLAERGSPKWVTTWRQPTEARRFGVPGAHGVQIFRGGSSLMGEPSWKNNLPRLPLISFGLLWILLVAVLILGLVSGAFVLDRLGEDEPDYTSTFVQIDQQIGSALAIVDPEAKVTALEQANALIAAARAAGAPENELQARELTISSERDGLENTIRITEVERIGSLPEELKEGSPQVVHTAAGVFVVSGSLYQLHPETKEIEKILVEGSVVDSAVVRSLFGIGFDSEGLYVTDGLHLFVLDASNQWIATEMEEINQLGAWKPGPIDAFSGNVYLLDPSYYNIYRFESNPENGVAMPNEWVNTSDRNSLDAAIDMTIDGNIYVLLADGTVQTFFRGDLASEFVPNYLGTGLPVALLNGTATGYLYVAVSDGETGRVLAFDPEGKVTYQLKLPVGFDSGTDEVMEPFENVQDITVDEATGILYVVNGDGIWSMRYTLPELEQPEDPGATPDVAT